MFATVHLCQLLYDSLALKDCAPGFLVLPPTVVALPEEVPPVTFCLCIVSIQMTSPAVFVVSNNQLSCFRVILPLQAVSWLGYFPHPSCFPPEVLFQHFHYPCDLSPSSFLLPSNHFLHVFCPSDLTFLLLKLSLWSDLILFSLHILLSFVDSYALSPTLYLSPLAMLLRGKEFYPRLSEYLCSGFSWHKHWKGRDDLLVLSYFVLIFLLTSSATFPLVCVFIYNHIP